jgi:hypothetical protein
MAIAASLTHETVVQAVVQVLKACNDIDSVFANPRWYRAKWRGSFDGA